MKSYNKTFVTRESKAILGKRHINFWILCGVFTLTLGALGVSRAGLAFLDKKMNDPFIKWVQVKEQADFGNFQRDILSGTIAKDSFSISSIDPNKFILEYVFTADFKKYRVEGRTINPTSQLLPKILDEDNTIIKRSRNEISYTDFGWIVTKDLMDNLGYTDENHYPLFINFTYPGKQNMIDSLGIENIDGFIIIPIPIIAVVKQLPDLIDFIAPQYFEEQLGSNDNPFNISLHDYYSELVLVVENTNQDLENEINGKLKQSGLLYDEDWTCSDDDFDYALRDATKYRIIIRDANVRTLNKVAREICNIPDVYRFYNYAFDKGRQSSSDYMSFMFDDLNKVQDFAKWSKSNYGVRIEMAQIDSKNNFNTFNQLANGLCIAIIAISVLFVVIFLWVLINTHFQKISKNLGTIMAFGLDNMSIMNIYLFVFMKLILISLSLAILLLLGIQYASILMGGVRMVNGIAMPYINMLDNLVIGVACGIVVLSGIVNFIAIKHKLRATPGDLIFERNH